MRRVACSTASSGDKTVPSRSDGTRNPSRSAQYADPRPFRTASSRPQPTSSTSSREVGHSVCSAKTSRRVASTRASVHSFGRPTLPRRPAAVATPRPRARPMKSACGSTQRAAGLSRRRDATRCDRLRAHQHPARSALGPARHLGPGASAPAVVEGPGQSDLRPLLRCCPRPPWARRRAVSTRCAGLGEVCSVSGRGEVPGRRPGEVIQFHGEDSELLVVKY
jgi:hypothetical protein